MDVRKTCLRCCILPAVHALRGGISVAWRDEWNRLVESNVISSSAVYRGTEVRYGLRLAADGCIEEFCQDAATGSPLELKARRGRAYIAASTRRGAVPIEVILRANRALRPPPAPKLGSLPPHDSDSCSMCTGPLRLADRQLVAQELLESGRRWDIHFNVLNPRLEFPDWGGSTTLAHPPPCLRGLSWMVLLWTDLTHDAGGALPARTGDRADC